MKIIAVDPGLTGAIAVLDTETQKLDVVDMPTTKNARKGAGLTIIDAPKLHELICNWRLWYDASHIIIEEVGGMPKQSAPAAFNFGYGCGLVYMAAVAADLSIELVTPQRWKGNMKVSTTPAQIRSRATEVFPFYRAYWDHEFLNLKSPTSEVGLGRAEAALLAAYGQRMLGA